MMMEGYFPNYSTFGSDEELCAVKDEDASMKDVYSHVDVNAESKSESENDDYDDDDERITSCSSDGGELSCGERGLDPENGPLCLGQTVDVVSLLSSKNRDYLVDSNGDQVKVSSLKGNYILVQFFELPVSSHTNEGILCWTLKHAIRYWSHFKLVALVKMDNNNTSHDLASAAAFYSYQHCHANGLELEVVLVYLPLSDDPPHFIACANAALKDKGISSWWLLPFQDFTSRNLWNLCDQSLDDEFVIVGPRAEFMDTWALDILNRSSDSIRNMYPYAVEAIARQETERLHKLTLDSLLPNTCLLSAQTGHQSCCDLKGKTVCLFIADLDQLYRPREALGGMRDWCRENSKRRKDNSNIVLVFVPLHSTKFTRSSDPRVSWLSDPELSWLSDPAMSWLICPYDPQCESSIMKHATLRGLPHSMSSPLSFITFGQDGKLISMSRPRLSKIQSRGFRCDQFYKVILDKYVQELYDHRSYV